MAIEENKYNKNNINFIVIGVCVVIAIITVIPSVTLMETTSTIIKDLYIPEIRIVEILSGLSNPAAK